MTTYVCCRLAFALLRSAIMCILGARSSHHRPVNALRELAVVEWGPPVSGWETMAVYITFRGLDFDCSCLKLVVLWLDSFHVGFGYSAWFSSEVLIVEVGLLMFFFFLFLFIQLFSSVVLTSFVLATCVLLYDTILFSWNLDATLCCSWISVFAIKWKDSTGT